MTQGTSQWLGHRSTKAAIALAVVGILFAFIEVQSPSLLYWTGEAVPGTNSGGIVFYRVDGEQYTIDDTGPVPARNTPVTVYVDRADPSHALLQKPTRWVDALAVLGWFVAAAACLAVSAFRRAAHRRRLGTGAGGQVPDESRFDWTARYVQRSRQSSGRT